MNNPIDELDYRNYYNNTYCVKEEYTINNYYRNCIEASIAKNYFELLINLLFSGRPNTFLGMTFDELALLRNRASYYKPHNIDLIRIIYDFYKDKYVCLLYKYIQNDLNKDIKEFLMDSFINDLINDFCKKGSYKSNLLCLEGMRLHSEFDIYTKAKVREANNIFKKDKDLSIYHLDYLDKLFDLSFVELDSDYIYQSTFYINHTIGHMIRKFTYNLREDKIHYNNYYNNYNNINKI